MGFFSLAFKEFLFHVSAALEQVLNPNLTAFYNRL